jgi:phage-related protein
MGSCTLVERKILVLHAYTKKSQKIPARELEVARKRLAEIQRRAGRWT